MMLLYMYTYITTKYKCLDPSLSLQLGRPCGLFWSSLPNLQDNHKMNFMKDKHVLVEFLYLSVAIIMSLI